MMKLSRKWSSLARVYDANANVQSSNHLTVSSCRLRRLLLIKVLDPALDNSHFIINNSLNTSIRNTIPRKQITAMDPSRDHLYRRLGGTLQRTAGPKVAADRRILPGIPLPICPDQSFRVGVVPTSCVGVYAVDVLAARDAVGVTFLGREEERTLALPVGRFDEAGDDGGDERGGTVLPVFETGVG